jgi:hypothetical protein
LQHPRATVDESLSVATQRCLRNTESSACATGEEQPFDAHDEKVP